LIRLALLQTLSNCTFINELDIQFSFIFAEVNFFYFSVVQTKIILDFFFIISFQSIHMNLILW
jgi:hypothetical protein